jgi:hypothetical protein
MAIPLESLGIDLQTSNDLGDIAQVPNHNPIAARLKSGYL